jgi:hypothetical protein
MEINKVAKQFKDIEEVAKALGDGGPFNPEKEYETVGALVDDLVDLGKTDKVYAFHDDHMGLKDYLSDDFLRSPLDNLDADKYESEIEKVVDQANIIIHLSEKELSEEDIEEIREDKIYRGGTPDDVDI